MEKFTIGDLRIISHACKKRIWRIDYHDYQEIYGTIGHTEYAALRELVRKLCAAGVAFEATQGTACRFYLDATERKAVDDVLRQKIGGDVDE